MARMRSPNYPAIGLSEAVDLVRLLWEREHQSPVDAEVAVKAMGYASLNGAARTKLSAVRKFGLTDGRGDSIRVSDLAMQILFPQSPEERDRAAREAALRPELFAELAEKFLQGSPDAIQGYLVRNQFSAQGAEQAAEAFKATREFARLGETGYNQSDASPEKKEGGMVGAVAERERRADSEIDVPKVGTEVLRFRLPGDRMAELRIAGGALTKSDINILRKYLEVTELTVGSQSAEQEKPA